MHDFILIYAKNKESVAVNDWERTEDQLAAYKNPDKDARGAWRAQDLSASKPYAAGLFTIKGPTDLFFDPPPNRYWRCNQQQFESWLADNRIWWGVNKDARPMLKSFLSESSRGIKPHTWWDYNFAGHNKEATLELKDLFDGNAPFDTPKPLRLMQRLIDLFCSSNDLVLDFFCGSAAFGHAAMSSAQQPNKQNLRFILVQLPEPTQRPDYKTIAEISKERLRRAGKKIKAASPEIHSDIGFRVFKLDSSNIRAWNPTPEDLTADLLAHQEHLIKGRTENDILYELLLKLGLDLCVPVEQQQIAGKTVHSIGGGVLMACLTEQITHDQVEELAQSIIAWHKAQASASDSTCVFRDSAFSDDIAKTNLAAILNQAGIKNVRSL